MPLSARMRAHNHVDPPVGRDLHNRPLKRPTCRGFHIICRTDPAQTAGLFAILAARLKIPPIGQFERQLHTVHKSTAVVRHTHRIRIGQLLVLDQIFEAYFRPVDTHFNRCAVD